MKQSVKISFMAIFVLVVTSCNQPCPECPEALAKNESPTQESVNVGTDLDEEASISGVVKRLKYRTITEWLNLSDGLVDGHNISLAYNGEDSLTFYVVEMSSGEAQEPSDTIDLSTESGIRIETRIVENVAQFIVATTNGSHFRDSRKNTHGIGGTDWQAFDAKIANTQSPGGGVDPSPFFIGVDDARSDGVCEASSLIGTLTGSGINPAIRLSWDSSGDNRDLIVSSNKAMPGPATPAWKQSDRRVPRWGVDFRVPNVCSSIKK